MLRPYGASVRSVCIQNVSSFCKSEDDGLGFTVLSIGSTLTL